MKGLEAQGKLAAIVQRPMQGLAELPFKYVMYGSPVHGGASSMSSFSQGHMGLGI